MDPVLRYSFKSNLFGLMNARDIQRQAKRAGLTWDPRGFFSTPSAFAALQFAKYADAGARRVLLPYMSAVADSQATDALIPIPAPRGLRYLPFQKAGISYASRRMNCLLGDEPGLGKTIQAIGLANYLGLSRILVVCPAGLRLNWAREIEKWHMPHLNAGIDVVLNGKSPIQTGRSIVVSYELAITRRGDLMTKSFDLVVADEAHYLKTPTTHRTKNILGNPRTNIPGLVSLAPRRLVLTGTPIPNRVDEIYPVIRALAPETIDRMNYHAFLAHYAVVRSTDYGDKIIGIKHEAELHERLRAGFMVRRLKSDVLKDLPPKTYKLVVFSKEGFSKVLERERQFSAREIITHGVPVGSALPEIRHEMGVAKAPLAAKYIEDLLESGVRQIVVFAHHRDVIRILAESLRGYGIATVTGDTGPAERQAAVDDFQSGKVRVIICNIVAGGVGVTLTAGADVVFVEASWVPGENEQAEDRAHRVGQTRGVLIHHLVVEESLDATILGSAAVKRGHIKKILDGGCDAAESASVRRG
jgi:SNF2 family DNA or RNA helicase